MKKTALKSLIFTLSMLPIFTHASVNIAAGMTYMMTHNSGENWQDELSLQPEIQLTFDRKISTSWRLGTGLSYVAQRLPGHTDSRNILLFKVANFSYQLTPKWRVGFSGNMGRYERLYPGFGYGLSFSTQYQFTENWAVAMELNGLQSDISGTLPQESGINERDTLIWTSLLLKRSF